MTDMFDDGDEDVLIALYVTSSEGCEKFICLSTYYDYQILVRVGTSVH